MKPRPLRIVLMQMAVRTSRHFLKAGKTGREDRSRSCRFSMRRFSMKSRTPPRYSFTVPSRNS